MSEHITTIPGTNMIITYVKDTPLPDGAIIGCNDWDELRQSDIMRMCHDGDYIIWPGADTDPMPFEERARRGAAILLYFNEHGATAGFQD